MLEQNTLLSLQYLCLLFARTLLLRISHVQKIKKRERREGRKRASADNPFAQYYPDKHTCSCFIWCSCSRRSDTLRFIPWRLTCIDGAPAGWWMTAESIVANAFFPPDKLAAPAISSSTGWAHQQRRCKHGPSSTHWIHTYFPQDDKKRKLQLLMFRTNSGLASPYPTYFERKLHYQSTALPQDCFLPHVLEMG